MLETVPSRNGVLIRLTDERWAHITEEHCELAGMRLDVIETVANPDRVLSGKGGEFLAVREINPGRNIVAVYRETEGDGFVITAFVTSKTKSLDQRVQIWPI